MHFSSQTASAVVLLSLLRLAHSIPCHEIGVGPGGYDDEGYKYNMPDPPPPFRAGATVHPFKDPFTAGQGFDIVKSEDCFLRFQSANHEANTATEYATRLLQARITQSTWSTTQADVDATIMNFGGGAVNQPLWLTGGSEPYQYTGILTSGEINMLQPGLADLSVVVTYLLPSGVAKVQTVESSGMWEGEPHEGLGKVMAVGIKGISGTVDPGNDYAYATVGTVSAGLQRRFAASNFPSNLAYWASDGPYVTATKGNGDCVVIDFRSVPPYLRYVDGQPESPMCNWNPSR